MPSIDVHEQLLLRLCRALERQNRVIAKQATAIDRLAESNEDLVDALMEQAPELEESDETQFDLSGRPLQ